MTKPKTPAVPEAAVSGVVPSSKWTEKVKNFAETCDLQAADVEAKFTTLVGKPSDKAADRLGSDKFTPFDEICALFPDVPKAVMREAVEGLRDIAVTVAPAAQAHAGAAAPVVSIMLPPVPDTTSLLAALGTFGGSKVDATDVIAASQVKLAEHLGLDDIEARLSDAIEKRAVSMGEQCPPIWDELEAARTRYAHADVLKALGKPGNLISSARKKELMNRIDGLFGSLEEYQGRLTAYQEAWMQRISNPAALMAGIASMMGGMGNPAAASLSEAPDTGPVLSATEGLIENWNGMFAGNGRAVARGIAADTISRRQTLERSDLPAALGASSREEMLRTLGIGVSSDLIRAERDVAQYIMGVMHLLTVGTAQLPGYVVALQQCGQNIPWTVLAGRGKANGASRPLPGNRSFG